MPILKPLFLSLATLVGTVVLAAPVLAAVDVTFVDPEHYIDGGGKGAFNDLPTKAAVEREIRAHLVGLGERNLKPGETLKVEILDIDLAGRRDVLGSAGGDVRIYDQLNSPRIKLRFSLEDGGRPVLSGEDTLADPLYLNTLVPASTGDPLRYERPMLTKWFMARIAGPRG